MLARKLTDKKIVVVTRQTRMDELRARFNSMDQAAFFVERRGGNFDDYVREAAFYASAVELAGDEVSPLGHAQFIDRTYLPNFVFGPDDTVVAIGQDGLVANTLKYLRDGQPLIGVNPDPERWDGVLLPFAAADLPEIIPEVLAGNHRLREVTMAEATMNDGQRLLAVNDFFVGQRSHTSARYRLAVGGRTEQHSSSGVIVSTGLGSTGWLRSLLGGAAAIAGTVTGSEIPLPRGAGKLGWDDRQLVFTVREPFPSKTTQTGLVFGRFGPEDPLVIRSLMPENGVVFSDGIESDFLEFNSGAEVTITVSGTRGHLVVR